MKRLPMLITAIAVMIGGMAFAAPTANAATGDFHFTVTAKSFDHASQSATIKSQTRLTINGAQQLTWENPDHNVKVTKKQVRKAPKITTKCTDSNRFTQSKQIFKKTHGARIVVLKPGSCAWNRGLRDNIHVGFAWHIKVPAVLVVDRNHRYRHAFNVVGGKLVKTCLNFIGGPVDEFTTNPVQVRYQQDVEYSGELEVKSAVSAEVTFNVSCPNGANFNTKVNASAYGYARDELTFTERTRVSVVGAKRLTLNDSSWLHAEQEAVTDASLSITVEGTCGENPPPVVHEAPSISVNPGACVKQGETTGVVTVVVTNPNPSASPADVTVGSTTKHVDSIAAHSSVTLTFTGFGPGTYGVTAVLTAFDKTATTSVTVAKCDTPPPVDHAPQISCVFPAHVYVGGNVYLWCEASDSDGDALSVNIVGDQFAHVSGVIPSDVRWDGTACPAGTSCYRATLWGDQVGTSHVVATVTANGKSSTSSGDVPIKADEF